MFWCKSKKKNEMKLLASRELLEFNVNHSHDIDSDLQKELRLGNTQFIIEAAQELKLQE